MSLLEVKNLKVHFHDAAPDRFAVDGVSFTMEEGDILGLVGESGTGKTVTSMCIGGLLPREKADTEGSITLGGTEIFDCTQKELNRILGNEMAIGLPDRAPGRGKPVCARKGPEQGPEEGTGPESHAGCGTAECGRGVQEVSA